MINEGAVKTVHRVKETDREAPPSLLLREDFWQVMLFNMMETWVIIGVRKQR